MNDIDIRLAGVEQGEWITIGPDRFAHATVKGYGRTIRRPSRVCTANEVIRMQPDETTTPFSFRTQAEREYYEYTPFGQTKLLAPHINVHDQTARHRRVEQLHRRLKCSWKQAFRIHRAFETIEADAKIVDAFIEKQLALAKKGLTDRLEPGIEYIEMLACELAKLAPAQPEDYFADADPPETVNPYKIDPENVWTCSEEFMRRANMTDDREVCEWERMEKEYSESKKVVTDQTTLATAELIGYHPVEKQERDWITSQPLSFQLLIRTVKKSETYSYLSEISKYVKTNDWESYLKKAVDAGLKPKEIRALQALVKGKMQPYNPAFDYKDAIPTHKTDQLPYADGMRSLQLEWLQDDELLDKLDMSLAARRENAYGPSWMFTSIFRLDKDAIARTLNFWFEHIPPMTKTQTSVFYSYRNIQYSRFGMGPVKLAQVRPQGQKLLTRIFETKSVQQLKWLAAQMMKFQKREIPGSRLTEPEWHKIWQAYKERKADFTQKAA